MNQGRVWCVVSPNVGLPLLLGSVAITSLIVHASVMTHTNWMSSYWSGSWKTKSIETTPPPRTSENAPKAAPAFAVTVTPLPGQPGTAETAFVVSVTPNPGSKPVDAAANDPVPRPPGPLAAATPPAD